MTASFDHATPPSDHATSWRELTVGFVLPDEAFGAAVDVEGLLFDPELHYTAQPTTSRLMLMPRAGTFTRLLLEWENLPEIGVFTSGSLGADAPPPDDVSRLETWMRDVAVVCHTHRDRIREASERAVRDATLGLDDSLPAHGALHADVAHTHVVAAHVVSAHVGTSVRGPSPSARVGVVDVVAEPGRADEVRFVERETGRVLGRRITRRSGDDIVDTALVDDAPGVTRADLAGWYDQHIAREVLFDDVWQVYVHLIAGLDAPASVRYLG